MSVAAAFQAEMDALKLDKHLAGIDVVGMPRERAWEIALNAKEPPMSSRRNTLAVERAREVASLARGGLTRSDICERLNLTKAQFDHLRQIARRKGLL